jgi:hypothetical protein
VRKYETFLENANQLNQLETYPQLTTRSEAVGYRINKVVFRGYQATEKLQVWIYRKFILINYFFDLVNE